jgi:glutathione S-transferase
MPIVHGVNASPFVRKLRVALAEKGIQYELNPVMPVGVSAEYKKKSPLGKIPCWEEDGYVLPDSSCIIAYLERTTPTPALYPADARQFGRALWYEEYCDTRLTEVIGPVFFERVVKGALMKQEPDEARARKAIAEDQPPVFDYLEGEIAERDFLAGARFSVADIACASPFVNLAHAGEAVDASRWPRLAAYLERIHARPSFKALIEEEKAAFSRAGGR